MSVQIHDTAGAVADALRSLPEDRYLARGQVGYDAASVPWNRAVVQHPAAVVAPRTVEEVRSVVKGATAAGLRVAAQSTGHNAGPLAAHRLDDVLLLRTAGLRSVTVDPSERRVRVGGGALWLPAVEAAATHGLAALHGSSPDVGVAGYALGGGIGWYARRLGLAANSVTAVELVTADGDLVRADARENTPLFWALRGGGAGSFGVVTALELALYPITTAYAGMMVWDIADAERVLRRWADWALDAPDEVTTSFRILRLPPVEEVPQHIRGRAIVVVDGAVLADDDASAEAVVADLRSLGPETDTFQRVAATSLTRLHMDPEGGAAGVSDSVMLDALPDDAIGAFLEQVGPGVDSVLGMAEIRQLGGALGRTHEDGGVLSRLGGQFLAFAGAMAMTEESADQGRVAASQLVKALSAYASDQVFLNFSENPVDVSRAFRSEVWTQLKGIRSAFDPNGLFLGNHQIPRLFEGGRPTP